MAERPIASILTHFGVLVANPTAILIVLIYAALWFVFERNTQAIYAKLDEVLRALEGA